MPQDYSKTLNLPNTDFSMRANLPTREPEIGSVWAKDDIYNKMLEKNEGKPLFILHDGPPFSNGNIHLLYYGDGQPSRRPKSSARLYTGMQEKFSI